MKKRMLPILVSLMAMLVMVPLIAGTAYAATIPCEDGLEYRITPSEGTAEVCGRVEGNESATIKIASTLTYNDKTYDVTSVEGAAFWRDTKITELIVEDGVTAIGGMAFDSCSNLAAITLPDSVSFPKNAFTNTAFYNATGNWSDGVLYINNHLVAANTNISACEIPDNTVTIASNAFENCGDLSSVTIPASVQKIGHRGFLDCNGLLSVTFASDSQLKEIGASAFDGCKLTSIDIPTSVDTIGSFAFYGNKMETVVLPEGLEVIDTKVFGDCEHLKDVTIPTTVKEIKADAFDGCSSLTTIHFGGTPTQWAAITGSGNLQDINIDCAVTQQISATVTFKVAHGSWNEGSGDAARADKTVTLTGYVGDTLRLTADQIPAVGDKPDYTYKAGSWDPVLSTETEIAEDTTFTYTYAEATEGQLNDEINWTLVDNGALTLKLADGVSSAVIPDYTYQSNPFMNNARIKSVVIESGITRAGSYIFDGCTGITSVTLPDGLTSIGQAAFADCTALAAIDLPDSLTKIERAAFTGSGLKSIDIPDSVTEIDENAFSDCLYLKNLKISAGITEIKGGAFGGLARLKSLVIPDGVNTIRENAFVDCTELREAEIAESVEKIEASAFFNCISLEKIVFKGDFCIEPYAFYLCNFTAYYPLHNDTWDEDAIDTGYGGKVKWVGYCNDPQPGTAVKKNVKAATALKAGSYDSVVYCKVCKQQLSSKKVTIKKLTPTIKLSATKKTLKKGKTYKLKVSKLAKGDAVKSFKTSKKSVATVTSKGVIKAKKKGKATITVTLKSGKTAKCKITVKK